MWIDIIFLIVFVYGFWQGWSQGIIGTILNIAIYLFGIVLAYKMAPVTSPILENLFASKHPMMFLFAFALNLGVIVIIVKLASGGLEDALHGAYMGMLNRVLGGGVVAGFYVLLYSVLLWFAAQVNAIPTDAAQSSRTLPFLQKMPGSAKAIVLRLRPTALDIWDDSLNWMDQMQEYGVDKTNGGGKIYEIPEPGKGDPLFQSKPKDTKPVAPAEEKPAIE